mgnify:CR=1 FL=1
MKTIDILICTLNKGIVRISDILMPPREEIHYIVSFQYTDERYLDLIPTVLETRDDVSFYKMNGQGLSCNRNNALEKATHDLVMFADDDTRLLPDAYEQIIKVFNENDIDVAFFQAATYTGKPLKDYPDTPFAYDRRTTPPYSISAIEMVCRRMAIQGVIRFDERFGLGTQFLTCGEEEIWLEDALRAGLKMKYFPVRTVETSTMLKKKMVYVDAGVQRSRGAMTYYRMGHKAWAACAKFALRSSLSGMCHFWPMMHHLAEGIRYMQRTK